MRICIVSRGYPRDEDPGTGLAAAETASRTPGDILFIAKRQAGNFLDFPRLRLATFSYWEPHLPEKFGMLQLLWIAAGKSIGYIWFLLQAMPTLMRFKPDIVHAQSILAILFATFGKLVLRKPVVMTFRGTDSVRVKDSRLLQRLVDLSVDVLICVSSAMASEMTPLLRKTRVIYLPNGVDLNRFKSTSRTRRNQIIAVGNLKWQKGYDYLLPAMQTLVAKEPSLKLLIAGSGPLEQEMRKSIRFLGLEENVQLLGAIPQDEVAKLLNESRAFVMSSVSEGFPKALLEAMACGTPVVVTDVGECRAVAEGAGYTVPPRSAEALSDALHELMSDEPAWQAFSAQGAVKARGYSWEETVRRTTEVYDELLESGRLRYATRD